MTTTADTPLRRTPLHAAHVAAGAKLVPFGGWEMPLHYGSQIEEHHAVRRGAGMFDTSHMLALDVLGPDARAFLRYALAGDVARLETHGQALYSCMLNHAGGIVDDVIAYAFGDDALRVIVNAGPADGDLAWLRACAAERAFAVTIAPRRDLAMIAIQGPRARDAIARAVPALGVAAATLAPFHGVFVRDWMIARTGYTGEDGCEILLPVPWAQWLWDALRAADVHPCGLGARDTLRLEAGLNLYGQDMDATTSPHVCGLGWTVHTDTDRAFVGRDALAAQNETQHQVGLVLLAPGVLRAHQVVHSAHGDGITTSGSFAPTLNKSIAFARVPLAVAIGDTVEVAIRDKRLPARVVKPRFVRHGQPLVAV